MDLGESKVLEFRAEILRIYLLLSCGISAIVIPIYYFIGIEILTALCGVYAATVAINSMLFLRGKIGLPAAARWFIAMSILVTLAGLYLGDEIIDNKPWQFLVPILAYPITGPREGSQWSAIACAAAIVVFILRGPAYEILSVMILVSAFSTLACALYFFSRYNEQNIRTIARLSHTDSLTGTFNRQLFDELSNNAFSRSRRAEEPLAIYMIDIDHFKEFNDRYGHVAGDRALVSVATVIRNSARRGSDMVFRYGGEEFCVVSTGVNETDARILAEHIINGVRALEIQHAGAERGVLTVSVGLSHHSFLENESAEGILKRADSALYQAKRNGRDRFEQNPKNGLSVVSTPRRAAQ